MKRLAAIAASICGMIQLPAVDYLREVKPVLAEHCYRCHGASQQKGGLRLDTAASIVKGGEHGPAVIPGKEAESLLLQVVKGTHATLPQMPYKKSPLTDLQIAALGGWVAEGAKAPAREAPESSKHWAFLSPAKVTLPDVRNSDWPRNSIDHFILARLEAQKLRPSPEAERRTLIRRLFLDLTGLPPTPETVAEFVADRSPGSYEKLVDRLLASPHYGERWGRQWLDVARYADSNGYSIDAPRSIWKYRDWVVTALNADMPFDQFTVEQLAGDLLPGATVQQKIATGFHRNTQINQEGGIDPEQFRVESIVDRVNTTATAFLGLTVACAQCHDHKFDPISQREYYQLFAFFNNTVEDGHGKSAPEGVLEIPGEWAGLESVEKELEEAEADLMRYLDTKGSEVVNWEQSLAAGDLAKLSAKVRAVLKLPYAERSTAQKRLIYGTFRSDDNEFKQRTSKLAKLERRQPKPITTLVMVEQQKPRTSHVFIKGDFTRKGAVVEPGVLEILHPLARKITAAKRSRFVVRDEGRAIEDGEHPVNKLNRLDLANWIVDPANPLTARVTVNRIWQAYFGSGLVETENDFGTQGTPPSHPELLDWLATKLVAEKWSLKAIHRLIVTSAAYRQASRMRPDLAAIDPNNRLLARQSRIRLEAEAVRDVGLQASGLLTPKIGGPGVFPPQPAGVMTLGQSKRVWVPSVGSDRYRRGLYTFFWRATPHPSLTVFDGPDAFSACTRRVRSNTPLQALTLLNDEASFEFAQELGRRISKAPVKSDGERIDFAFLASLSRYPTEAERQRLLAVVAAEENPLDAWATVARVVLNLDETITRE